MPKSLVRFASAWAFERPLAVALAAAASFALLAMPVPWSWGAHLAAALVAGAALGLAGYAAMRFPYGRSRRRRAAAEALAAAEADSVGQIAAAEVSVRLRRADRHPDAPARAPIFASRDLGSPFMEVGAFAPPPADEVPEAEFAEVADEEPVVAADERADVVVEQDAPVEGAPEPVASEPEDAVGPIPVPADEPLHLVPDETLAAFSPAEDPAPPRARAHRPSLDAMMERLQAGLERRARDGRDLSATMGDVLAARRDRGSELRQALEELNRLATARH